MPSCNVYYVIQRAPASNRPGSSAPSLNGTLGYTWANPNSFGGGCTTGKPDESVVGANAGAAWSVGNVNGLNFYYYTGKKRGADTVTFGVTFSECAAHPDWSYNVYVNGVLNGHVRSHVVWGSDERDGACRTGQGISRVQAAGVAAAAQQQCLDDPVNDASGGYSTAVTDVTLAAPGLPFSLTRYYRSDDNTWSGWSNSIWHNDFETQIRGARPAPPPTPSTPTETRRPPARGPTRSTLPVR